MTRLFLGFIVGLVVGVGGYWWFTERLGTTDLNAARDKMLQGAGQVKEVIKDRIGEIRPEDVKEELSRTGQFVREKARQAGSVIADATADARITAAVKAKLLKEPGLSPFKIHVDTSNGLVTLSGTVASHDDIARAVRLTLETEGVQKVVSTLQVKPAGAK